MPDLYRVEDSLYTFYRDGKKIYWCDLVSIAYERDSHRILQHGPEEAVMTWVEQHQPGYLASMSVVTVGPKSCAEFNRMVQEEDFLSFWLTERHNPPKGEYKSPERPETSPGEPKTMPATSEVRVIRNKFAKACYTCGRRVEEDQGYAVLDGAWKTYCGEHLPVARPGTTATKRELTQDGYIVTGYEPENLSLIKSAPGARWTPDRTPKAWKVSLAIQDRQRVLEIADRLGLEVHPSLREVETSKEATQLAQIPGIYPYQLQGSDWLAKREKGGILGDDMGLGKSVQTLASLRDNDKVVLVVPASLKGNWADEVARWRPTFKITILKGRDAWKNPEAGEIVCLNYDILPAWLEPTKAGLLPKEELKATIKEIREDEIRKVDKSREGWSHWADARAEHRISALKAEQTQIKRSKGAPKISLVPEEIRSHLRDVVLVCDEAHALRNFQSARSTKVHTLSRLVKKVIALTGTPLMNHPNQLFSVLDSLNLVGPSFGGWTRFCQEFHAKKGKYGMEWGSPTPMVPELLRRVMLRRRREEVLPDLPRKTYQTVKVPVSDTDLVERLNDLYEDYGDYLEGATGDDDLPPFEEFSSIRADLAKDRLGYVESLVESYEDQETPVLVFSAHRAVVDALAGRPGWASITGSTPGDQRQQIVRDFQAGKYLGLSGTIQAAGLGLTLTHAHHEIFVDLDWTPALNQQAEDRCCRIGQKADKVMITRLVSDHPLDTHVHRLLEYKIGIIEGAVEAQVAVVKPAAIVGSPGETQEEFQARMERIEQELREAAAASSHQSEEAAKKAAKARVGEILARERAKAIRPELPLTPERIAAVHGAHQYLLSVCDGAHEKDFCGFSRPDTLVARILARTALETEDEIRTLERIVSRYYRQTHELFPVLFS